MSRAYYTLAVLDDNGWSPQFGDYRKSVVAEELQSERDSGVPRRRLQIVQSGDLQYQIDDRIKELNR